MQQNYKAGREITETCHQLIATANQKRSASFKAAVTLNQKISASFKAAVIWQFKDLYRSVSELPLEN